MKRKLIIGLQAIAVTVVAVVGTAFAADAGSASKSGYKYDKYW